MAKNVSRLCPVPLEGKVTWLITTLEMCFLPVSGSHDSQLSALEARRGEAHRRQHSLWAPSS